MARAARTPGAPAASAASGLQVGRERCEVSHLAHLLRVRVGPHVLVFDLRTILAIESAADRVEHEAIKGPIDLRAWLGVPATPAAESILVPGTEAVYRLEVCRIGALVQTDLRAVHRVPHVLRPLLDRLAVRGLVELPEVDDRPGAAAPVLDATQLRRAPARELGFLVDPLLLAQAAWSEAA